MYRNEPVMTNKYFLFAKANNDQKFFFIGGIATKKLFYLPLLVYFWTLLFKNHNLLIATITIRKYSLKRLFPRVTKNLQLHVTKQYVNPLIIIDGTEQQVPKSPKCCHILNILVHIRKMDITTFNDNIAPMRQMLMNKARSMTNDESLAEDMVQETMLKLWSIRSELTKHPNTAALAVTILRNKMYDHQRKRREYAINERSPEHGTEDNRAEANSDRELIKRIADSLPTLQREIFRMKEIEGYEAEEIIAITGCSPEALRQNLSRARRKIREEFVKQSNYNRQ